MRTQGEGFLAHLVRGGAWSEAHSRDWFTGVRSQRCGAGAGGGKVQIGHSGAVRHAQAWQKLPALPCVQPAGTGP